MAIKHNKKRNTGLVKEFLARTVTNALLTGDKETYNKSIAVIKKYFAKDKELYKESKLFEGLVKQHGFSKEKAKFFLDETRLHVSRQDANKLEEEKHNLLLAINKSIADGLFFEREIPNYKLFASVQTLFNYWRNPTIVENIELVFKFEEMIIEQMCKEPVQTKNIEVEKSNEDINSLVVKLMSDKFNEKYKNISQEQKTLFSDLLVSTSFSHTVGLLEPIEKASRKFLENYCAKNNAENFLVPKLKEIHGLLETKYSTKQLVLENNLSEEFVLFYMKLLELNKEFGVE